MKPARSALIIDDEKQIRRLLRIALEEAGHQVHEAETGQAGLAEIVQRRPDVVLLDLGLPDMKKEAPALTPVPQRLAVDVTQPRKEALAPSSSEAVLCAIRSAGRTLDFALREAASGGSRLYVLFVREQPFMTEQDVVRKWQEDAQASEIFAEAKRKADNVTPLFCYAVSPSAAETIVDVAATLGASRVILGAPQRSALMESQMVIPRISTIIPSEMTLGNGRNSAVIILRPTNPSTNASPVLR